MIARSEPDDSPGTPPATPREAVARWRLVIARDAIRADTGQRDQAAAWEAALVATGLPLAGLDAPKGRPRFAAAAPLAASVPGEAELVDVWLVERLPRWMVREALAAGMPAGHRLVDLYDVWLGEAALPGRVLASVYRASLAPGAVELPALEAATAALLREESIPRERRKGEAAIAYDLRPFIERVEVLDRPDGPAVRMVLLHDPERGIGRPEELLAALGDRLGSAPEVRGLVREGLVLADPSPPAPVLRRTGPRPARRGGPAPATRR
jgi:hypothetical protein